MTRNIRIASLIALAALVLPLAAGAVVEPKSGTEYADTIVVDVAGEAYTLKTTGVGLREKTFMKVDVYTIVSYVGDDFAGADGADILAYEGPKRLQMDLRRGFSREKLVNSFSETIEKNYDDLHAFATDMEVFLAYFEHDAQEKDVLVFDFAPGVGLTTTLNGEVKGVITNDAFVEALWSIWLGEKPTNKGLRKAMLSSLQ